MKTYSQAALALVVAATLAGCSSSPALDGAAVAPEPTTEFFATTQSQIEQLTARVVQAQIDNLPYFAPKRYKKSYKNWDDANDLLQKIQSKPEKATAKNSAKLVNFIMMAEQQLDEGYQVKQSSEATLADSFSLMTRLGELDAQTLFARKFKKAQGKLDKMVWDIADGDIDDATKAQPAVLQYMTALEVETVEHIELSGLAAELEEMKGDDIEDHAPVSYERAMIELTRARGVIADDPRDVGAIATAVASVDFQIDHTRYIGRAAADYKKDKASYESVLLDAEEQLMTVSTYVAGIDYRDQPLHMQAAFIARDAEKQNEKTAELQAQLAQLELQDQQDQPAIELAESEGSGDNL